MSKKLGDDADPLLASVRSGAKFSMPGMMDTVLNLGLNDRSVEGLAKQTSNDRFAWDAYRQFVQMFGKIVLYMPAERSEERLDEAKRSQRDPATGEKRPYGDYLPNAQGEDVVAGIRNTLKLEQLGDLDPKSWDELRQGMDTLERHYRDMCDIEFTIERGKLWFLQTRVGKRTSFAEGVMAYDMWQEGLISREEGPLGRGPNRVEEVRKRVLNADQTTAHTPDHPGQDAAPG